MASCPSITRIILGGAILGVQLWHRQQRDKVHSLDSFYLELSMITIIAPRPCSATPPPVGIEGAPIANIKLSRTTKPRHVSSLQHTPNKAQVPLAQPLRAGPLYIIRKSKPRNKPSTRNLCRALLPQGWVDRGTRTHAATIAALVAALAPSVADMSICVQGHPPLHWAALNNRVSEANLLIEVRSVVFC